MRGEYSRMGETSIDLYAESAQQPWYFRTATTVLSWLACGGYILFAIVFTSAEANLKISKVALTALASAFLALGYGGAVAMGSFGHSLLFTFDAVLLPFLTSSIMGLFVIVMNHSLHRSFPISTDVYIYIPLVLASTTTITFGVLAYLARRKLGKMKMVDKPQRQHSRWRGQSATGFGDPQSTTELMPMEIPEDEAQRQQLLRLLFQREADRTARPGNSSTYKIDLPWDEPTDRYLVVPPSSRQRSGSLPDITNKWAISNLLGRRNRPELVVTNPREQRRQEIERLSLTSTPSNLDQSGWPQTPETRPAWAESPRYG